MTHGQLSGTDIRKYALAGNARFTIVSAATGTRFTYRVREKKETLGYPSPDLYFVSVLSGPENESDYMYLGIIKDGVFRYGNKSHAGPDAPSVKAFRWFWKNVDALPSSCACYHTGRCGRCGRLLTVPESVANGIGPECARSFAA